MLLHMALNEHKSHLSRTECRLCEHIELRASRQLCATARSADASKCTCSCDKVATWKWTIVLLHDYTGL